MALHIKTMPSIPPSHQPCTSLRHVARALVFAVLMGAAVLPASAQGIDSTLVTRYQLAEAYLRAAQFDRAIALLEVLVERSPETYVFFDKLREAYSSVKRYDDAIVLVEARIAPGEAGTPLRAEKARLQYLNGQEDLALGTWDEAIKSASDRPGTYLVVYRSLMQMRLFEKASEV
ncbi:MAG: tetratricopeptide (TPR) repeat protein, partial [Thalassolituus oleivorans]